MNELFKKLYYVVIVFCFIFCSSSISIAVQHFNDNAIYNISTTNGKLFYVSDDYCGKDAIVRLRQQIHAVQDKGAANFRIIREGDCYRIVSCMTSQRYGLLFCKDHYIQNGYTNVESGPNSIGDRGIFLINGVPNRNGIYRISGYDINYVPLYLRRTVDDGGTEHIKASINGTGDESLFIINARQ